jgi:hypothetical protein
MPPKAEANNSLPAMRYVLYRYQLRISTASETMREENRREAARIRLLAPR